jgi:molecular chaperone GrpE
MAARNEKNETLDREGDEAEETAASGNGAGGNGIHSEEAETSPGGDTGGLQAELDKVRAQLAERQDSQLRLQAEFENYKKRIMKEQSDQLKYAQLPLLKDLTQAMDNLERALGHIRSQGSAEAKGLAGGIEMVAKQMADTFERYGLTRVKTQGVPFDPTRHEAVSVVETDQVPENHVLQEFQAGYVLHDRVVRPAMVSVSKKAGGAGGGEGT